MRDSDDPRDRVTAQMLERIAQLESQVSRVGKVYPTGSSTRREKRRSGVLVDFSELDSILGSYIIEINHREVGNARLLIEYIKRHLRTTDMEEIEYGKNWILLDEKSGLTIPERIPDLIEMADLEAVEISPFVNIKAKKV
jgi:hypothetical protein